MSDHDTTTADRFGTYRSAGLGNLASRKKDNTPPASVRPLTLDLIPDPATPPTDGDLTPTDQQDLKTCAAVLSAHHAEYWITGKALDAIRKRRLYRADHDTFEDYLAHWEIKSSDAYRMMAGWKLAAALLLTHPRLVRAHVEALHPVVERWTVAAAVKLYGRLQTEYDHVTAQTISKVVKELLAIAGEEQEAEALILVHAQAAIEATQKSREKPRRDPDAVTMRTRAKALGKELGKEKLTAPEASQALAEAFVDADDDRVYVALRQWLKRRQP